MISLPLIGIVALLQAGSLPLTGSPADSTLVLGPGDSVQLFGSSVHEGGIGRLGVRRLDVLYATAIPASNSAARAAQADRVARHFGSQAIEMGAKRISVGICETQACARRQDPPAAWFLFERTSQGWRRVK